MWTAPGTTFKDGWGRVAEFAKSLPALADLTEWIPGLKYLLTKPPACPQRENQLGNQFRVGVLLAEAAAAKPDTLQPRPSSLHVDGTGEHL